MSRAKPAHDQFAMIPRDVLRSEDLSLTAKVVYGVVALYAWGHNPCKVGWEKIAEDCGLGRTATMNALKELIDRNWIRVERRKVRRGHANLYFLTQNWQIEDPKDRSRKADAVATASGLADEVADEVADAVAADLSYTGADGSQTKLYESREKKEPRTSNAEVRADAVGFSDWLAYHASVTSSSSPKPGTHTRRGLAEAYLKCHAELQANDVEPIEGLKRATRNAFADEFRREKDLVGPDNVLKVQKVLRLAQHAPRPSQPRQPEEHRPAAGSGYWSEAEEREKLMAQRRAGANHA
jgi:hypothetical protein